MTGPSAVVHDFHAVIPSLHLRMLSTSDLQLRRHRTFDSQSSLRQRLTPPDAYPSFHLRR